MRYRNSNLYIIILYKHTGDFYWFTKGRYLVNCYEKKYKLCVKKYIVLPMVWELTIRISEIHELRQKVSVQCERWSMRVTLTVTTAAGETLG